MKVKHFEFEIDPEKPFKNCQLGREPYAAALTSIVNNYADGFVLSINNSWGTGKTTFLRMWLAKLKNRGHQTIYFNSWENDFENNSLVAMMSELGELTNMNADAAYKDLISKAAIIAKNIVPSLVKAVAAKYIESEVFTESMKNLAEGSFEILTEEIKAYADRKRGLREFRMVLKKFVDEKIEKKPLIFVIDELDRCRPNYAVEVLEQVKHFFSVPGIVFVLSIDKQQLGNAIKGVYGSEGLDSNEYLRRFIDLEFSMPKPTNDAYCRYLIKYFEFDKYFDSRERQSNSNLKYDSEAFFIFSNKLFSRKNVTLRQQEKIFAHARLVLRTFEVSNSVFPSLFILLIYIKEHYPSFYNKLHAKQGDCQEILDGLKEVFPTHLEEGDEMHFLYTEVLFIVLYNNYRANAVRHNLVERNRQGKPSLKLKSIMDQSENAHNFIDIYESHFNEATKATKLDYLLNRINLMQSIIVDPSDELPYEE